MLCNYFSPFHIQDINTQSMLMSKISLYCVIIKVQLWIMNKSPDELSRVYNFCRFTATCRIGSVWVTNSRNCKQSKHKSSPRSNCRLASYVAVNDGVVWWLYQVRQSQSPSQTSICSNMDLPVQFGHTCLITQEGRGELLFPSFSFVCGLFIPIVYSRTERIRFEKNISDFLLQRREMQSITIESVVDGKLLKE